MVAALVYGGDESYRHKEVGASAEICSETPPTIPRKPHGDLAKSK
jgi:hypothetical protein